jgi:hypothetical protein
LRLDKSKWKSFFISNDAIHVEVKGGGENNNVEGINTSKDNDYMCVVHDVW